MVCVSVPDRLLCLSFSLVEFRQAIQIAIIGIVESLKDSDQNVRRGAISELSALGAHGLCQRP